VPVKLRSPKRLRPSFDPETLDLFVRLDAVKGGRRESRAFRDEEHDLARKLNLTSAWWCGQTPLDRSAGPVHPHWCCAHGFWHECRKVREYLLAAVEAREKA
jgi:hypothetical protein